MFIEQMSDSSSFSGHRTAYHEQYPMPDNHFFNWFLAAPRPTLGQWQTVEGMASIT